MRPSTSGRIARSAALLVISRRPSGQFAGIYKILHMKHPPDRALGSLGGLMDGATGKILGFSDDGVWILTWERAIVPAATGIRMRWDHISHDA